MLITTKIKLILEQKHHEKLLETMKRYNAACNYISGFAFEQSQYNRIRLQKLVYFVVRDQFQLSSQMTILAVRKVAAAYIADKAKKNEYKKSKGKNVRGQADLVWHDGVFYLLPGVELPENEPYIPNDALGVDLDIKNIAADSMGESLSGDAVQAVRHHCISKHLVEKAKRHRSRLALEDLTGIRERITVRRAQRRNQHAWAFAQLRSYIKYKALLAGVPVVLADPRNTSRECPQCEHTAKENRKTRDWFRCQACEYAAPADNVAALNIRSRAIVSVPNVGVAI